MALAAALLPLMLACDGRKRERRQVAEAIQAQLDAPANVNVAFMGDSTHLLIQLDPAAFGDVADTTFERRAMETARVGIREYDRAATVDRVTVSVGEVVVPGSGFVARRVSRKRTFSVAELR